MTKSFLSVCIISLLLLLPEKVCAVQQIDENAAHKLGILALIGTPDEGGALESSFDTPNDDGFYVMQGWGRHSTFGWFAVNAWTGDMWNLGGSNCTHLSNPTLRKEQKKIKKQFKDKKEYERLSRLKPRRMYDLEFCGSLP
jgi:hypothetical protein